LLWLINFGGMIIEKNSNLKELNTFGVEARADMLVTVESIEDMESLFDQGLLNDSRFLVLGEGSNVLFTCDYHGLILRNRLSGIEIVEEDDDDVFIRVAAGENWSELVDYTVKRHWGGLENLSLIPGSAGAAPVQNIGAYGVELKDVLDCVEVFDFQTGEKKSFSVRQCELGYRSSIFKTRLKGRYMITSIVLKLTKVPELNLGYTPLKSYFNNRPQESISLKEVSDAVKSIRRTKLPDPEVLGNAGSFFKNPVVPFSKIEELAGRFPEMPFYKVDDDNYKVAAGWLIENSGWKGKRMGDAGVHEKQALVLVNYGRAGGKEIMQLAGKIQDDIFEKYGIQLEREVTVIHLD